MNFFTYGDYIRCIHKVKLNEVITLADENTEYSLISSKNTNRNIIMSDKKAKMKPHDRLIKSILKDKIEFSIFVNQFLDPKELLQKENLQKYTNSYITKKYSSKEADIVYKIKNKDIYFLLEHQSTIDYNMPYRILNYCMDILQEWSRDKKYRKNLIYPIVVPIVVYTGAEKCAIPTNFKDKQIRYTTFGKYKINLEYNLIDVNKYSKEELLSKKTIFAYMMLLEKSKDKKNIIENIRLIINNETNKERLNEIIDIAVYLLGDFIEDNQKELLLKEINDKVGDNKMEALIARIKEQEEKNWKRKERILAKQIEKRMRKDMQEKIEKEMQEKLEKEIQDKIEKEMQEKLEKEMQEKLEIVQEKEKLKIAKNILKLGQKDEFVKQVIEITNEELEQLKRNTI